jgi:S-formylglutathione hydrolase FrmB
MSAFSHLALSLVRILVGAPPEAEPPTPSASAPPPVAGRWLEPVTVTGVVDGKEASGELRVYVPAGYDARAASPDAPRSPLVLALHGWDHSAKMYADKGELGALADRHGFVVAIPDTGRTIFETRFYPQTRGKWTKAPGARWVGEIALPHVRRHFHVATDKQHTGVIGYSTGGRGAVLLAALYPEFAFVGSVSGTYDLMALEPKTGEYRIHAIIFGARDKYPERWRLDDVMAPANLARLTGQNLYVAHGDEDEAVPVDQLRRFEKALAQVAVASSRFVVTPGGGHDWALWNAHWPPMFEAMSRVFAGSTP